MVLRSKDYVDRERLVKTRNAQRNRYYRKTQGHKPRRWSDEEIELILVSEKTDTQLAYELNRSVKSIQVKRSKTKKMER